MNKINFVDQTIRNAQQSLWAFLMRTDMITPIAEIMDRVRFKAIGTVGGNSFVVQTPIIMKIPGRESGSFLRRCQGLLCAPVGQNVWAG